MKKKKIYWVASDAPAEEQRKYAEISSRLAKQQHHKERASRFFKILSDIILWICAVGGFVLSLIQFFQDSQ